MFLIPVQISFTMTNIVYKYLNGTTMKTFMKRKAVLMKMKVLWRRSKRHSILLMKKS